MADNVDNFAKQCKDAYQYMASLIERANQGDRVEPDELMAQLGSVVEQLSVAGEELSQQAEELATARNELAAQSQHYLELFEFAPDGYLVTTKDGTVLEANQAGAKMLNMSQQHLLGKPLSIFVTAAGQKEFNKRLTCLKKQDKAKGDSFEIEMLPRAGAAFQALVTAKASYDSEGKVVQLRWLVHDVSEYQKLEQERRLLLERLVTVHEEERTRFARELHDQMAQHLTALVIGLQSVKIASRASPVICQDVERLQRIAEDIGREAHDLATELRPAVLDDLGLAPAVSNRIQEWSEQTGIPVSIYHSGFGEGNPVPSPDITIAIYRIVQQSLTNILKHAHANHVSVVLDQRKDCILAIVEDNGIGFDVEKSMRRSATKRSLGLIGMRERAALVDGTVEIESQPGSGTTVFVRIPLLLTAPKDSAS
jgi:PAS domain S-box-containing protein